MHGMTGSQHSFDELQVPVHLGTYSLPMPISPGLLSSIPTACGSGLGAVLYQTCDGGTDAVVAYASRCLMKGKSHYPAHKLEFLTLTWFVGKKFHQITLWIDL